MLTITFNRPVPDKTLTKQCTKIEYLFSEDRNIWLPYWVLFYGDAVDTITARGDELEYIWKVFENIPICRKNSTNVWRGNFALFILENWV
jgi:hypothetical protein